MAYNQQNLSLLIGLRDNSRNLWVYNSTDAIATVRAANYITNAQAMGMKAQDIVWVIDTATPTNQFCVVVTVASTGADLADGTAIAQTNT